MVACKSRRPERVSGGAPWAVEECGGARVFAQLWQLRQWLTGLPRCSGHCERVRRDVETAQTRFRDDSGCAMGSSGHGGAPHSHAVAARRLDRSCLNEQSHRPRIRTQEHLYLLRVSIIYLCALGRYVLYPLRDGIPVNGYRLWEKVPVYGKCTQKRGNIPENGYSNGVHKIR